VRIKVQQVASNQNKAFHHDSLNSDLSAIEVFEIPDWHMAKWKTGTKVNHDQLSDQSTASPSRVSSILWYLAVIPSFWSFGFTTMWGSDLWWHIATGRWIVTHKALPLTDSWSFTRAGQPWLHPFSPYALHYLTVEDAFPIETCNFIEANQLSGNMFSYYNWGGYLHLRTDGRMKVYIDGTCRHCLR